MRNNRHARTGRARQIQPPIAGPSATAFVAPLALLLALLAAWAPPVEAAGSGGVLEGRALFEGVVPSPVALVVDKDGAHCKQAAGERQEVVVGANMGLAGVVVEVQGLKGQGEWQQPEGGYVIRQKGCAFAPEFLVIPAGTELTVHNNDPVLHNVNSGQWNIAQPGGKNEVTKRKMAFQGRPFVRVTCNVHSWMEAWVYVARSPYHAVTGTDGKFKIEGLPAGSYKATARHPKLRTQRLKFTVEAGKTTAQDVTFTPKSR